MANKRLTHEQRIDRRRSMAGAVTDTASIARVAAAHGVTLETVRAACRIYAPHKLRGNALASAPASYATTSTSTTTKCPPKPSSRARRLRGRPINSRAAKE